jgi:hypothetical protein
MVTAGYSLALLQGGRTAQRVGCFLRCCLSLLILLHAVGTVLSYVFYWLAVIVTLMALKWREGRVRVFGFESAVGKARRLRQANPAATGNTSKNPSVIHEDVVNPSGLISELPTN